MELSSSISPYLYMCMYIIIYTYYIFLLIRDSSHSTSATSAMSTSHSSVPPSSSRDIVSTTATTMAANDDNTATKATTPMSPIKPIETVPHVIKSRQNRSTSSSDSFPRGGKKRSADGLSSSPSSFTPLYPSRMTGGREPYGRDSSVILSRGDPSMFGTISDTQHCVKIIDESLHWDDRGADVSVCVRCHSNSYCCHSPESNGPTRLPGGWLSGNAECWQVNRNVHPRWYQDWIRKVIYHCIMQT